MNRRALTTGATLAVLVVVVCVMAVWGYRAATAPLPGDTSASTGGPDCAPEDQQVTRYVKRGDVTVSVYNAGKKSGRAQAMLALLERSGFKAGEVGNAPEGTDVKRAEVYSAKADDPAAELVAKAVGRAAKVVRSDAELGPGVALVIGDKLRMRLDARAPRKLALAQPVTSCE